MRALAERESVRTVVWRGVAGVGLLDAVVLAALEIAGTQVTGAGNAGK